MRQLYVIGHSPYRLATDDLPFDEAIIQDRAILPPLLTLIGRQLQPEAFFGCGITRENSTTLHNILNKITGTPPHHHEARIYELLPELRASSHLPLYLSGLAAVHAHLRRQGKEFALCATEKSFWSLEYFLLELQASGKLAAGPVEDVEITPQIRHETLTLKDRFLYSLVKESRANPIIISVDANRKLTPFMETNNRCKPEDKRLELYRINIGSWDQENIFAKPTLDVLTGNLPLSLQASMNAFCEQQSLRNEVMFNPE